MDHVYEINCTNNLARLMFALQMKMKISSY